MTPKEKAEELFDKYSYELSHHIFNGTFDIAKECAIIAVDEILWMASHHVTINYWQEVKQEIELL
jgi:hypothetical protein